jgi:hypothetical protein
VTVRTLTYSSETYTLRKKIRQKRRDKKEETAEMKFLGNVVGYILKDQIRNSDWKGAKYIQLK